MDTCLFVVVFFPGVIVSIQWLLNVVRGFILAEIKSSSALLKRQKKNLRATRPPPMLIFSSKSLDQNFKIAILFSIVKKLKN